MRHLVLLFLFLLQQVIGYASANDTIVINEKLSRHVVNGQERYFFTKKDLSLQQLFLEKFKPKDSIDRHEYITGFMWVKFVVKNNSDTTRFVLSANRGHISGFYMFKPTATGYIMTPPKLHHPEDGREIYNRRPAFFLNLKKGETKTFYLKIQVEDELVDLQYDIRDYAHYAEYAQADYMVLGLYLGALLIIIVVNIFYYISLKDSIFLIYAIYAFGTFLSSTTLDGFAWLLIPDTDVAYHVSYFCFRFWADALLFFIMKLVDLKKHYKRFTIVVYAFIGYHSLVMPILSWIDVFHMRSSLMGHWEGYNCMAGIALAFAIMIISYKDNKYLFKYYIIALSIIIILIPLYAFGIPDEYIVKAGTLIEMITLSFAVSRRFKLAENDLKQKKEQEQFLHDKVRQLEMDMRKAQMNPHFMSNALTSIEHFILSNNSTQARHYLNKFAKLMRLTLDHSRSNFVTLHDELDALKLYMELEFLRLQHQRHRFEIRISKNIDPSGVLIPPLLIQPLVENAIWQGLQAKENGGTLLVDVTLADNRLLCTIEDHGTRNDTQLQAPDQTTSGVLITKERLTLIHSILNTFYEFEVLDLRNEQNILSGTRIQFNMPYVVGDY